MASENYNDLISAIYEGPFEDQLWSTFLSRLRTVTKALYVGLFFRPMEHPRRSSLHLYSAEGVTPEFHSTVTTAYNEDEPFDWSKVPEGRAIRVSDIYEKMTPDQLQFYEGRFDVGAFRHGCIIHVTEYSGMNALLIVSRRSVEFPESVKSMLELLTPHLKRALRTYTTLEQENFRAEIATEAMGRLDFGWFSLNSLAQILDSSQYAMDLLNKRHGISVDASGTFRFSNPGRNRELRTMLERFSVDASISPAPFRISSEPWLEMLLVPIQKRPLLSNTRPVALAYLHGDTQPTKARERQISDLFGLLPSEARLALALARGLNLKEAAVQLGITEKTARSYSKQIYGKMGARGQADVVRFILNSVLMLA